MATLYVEKFPDELYDALRERARKHRSSIAKEVIALVEAQIPSAEELKRRQKFYAFTEKMRKRRPLRPGPFPSAEEMIREDRER